MNKLNLLKCCFYFVVGAGLVAVSGGCTKEQVAQAINTAGNSDLSDSDIVGGLKSALKVGTDTSVNLTHKVDGYFKNKAIKLLFPPDAQKIITTLQGNILTAGLVNSYVDKVVLSLNRAAEDAAVEAKPILVDAITSMSIQDGKNILFGDSLAATSYLKTKSFTNLKAAFKPKIKDSLD